MENAETIATLNDLIDTCKDGEFGFRLCSEHAHDPELRQVFVRRADDCNQAALALQTQVTQLGGEPDTGGTLSGALHRGWVVVRSKVSELEDVALLEECERGEDVALARYRDALQQPLPELIRVLVEVQRQGVQRNHQQIRTLRQRARAAH